MFLWEAWVNLINLYRKLQECTLLVCQEVNFLQVRKRRVRKLIQVRQVLLAKANKGQHPSQRSTSVDRGWHAKQKEAITWYTSVFGVTPLPHE